MSSTRWFFLRNKQTIIKKKYTPSREEDKMAVDRERDIDRFLFRIGVDFQKMYEFTLVVSW